MGATSTYLMTGFPGFVGKRLLRRIAEDEPQARIRLLVEQGRHRDAELELETAGLDRGRIEILVGDVGHLHLGLSGGEYRQLTEEVSQIFHLAESTDLTAARDQLSRVNVDGTRNMLELAHDCRKLSRFNHLSTAGVSGDRLGVICEDELEAGQGFRNAYESTKYEAERWVQRASASLPVTVYRPGSVVGDSQTGEIERFDGPYSLGLLVAFTPASLPLPLPGEGGAPFNVVPVDFVVQAIWALARNPKAVGRTFHLVDPAPLSARRAYELVAKKSDRRPPRFQLPERATHAVLRLPFWEKLARSQRAALQSLNHLAFYNCAGALELLEAEGIRCPPLPSYLDALLSFVRHTYRQRDDEASSKAVAE